jgi:hypothetical protein
MNNGHPLDLRQIEAAANQQQMMRNQQAAAIHSLIATTARELFVPMVVTLGIGEYDHPEATEEKVRACARQCRCMAEFFAEEVLGIKIERK